MRERLVAAVAALSLLLGLALVQPAAAQNPSRSRTPTPTPTLASPTPTPVSQPLFIDTASEGYPCSNGVCAFPTGNVATSYSAPITSGGGQGPTPYTWSVVAGSLPAGLTLTPYYGVYSAYVYGTPTKVQTSSFTLQVQDGAGHTARQAFSLTIDPTPPPVITSPNPCCPAGTVGTPYTQGFFLSGGVAPYTYAISAGQLPPGVLLDCPSPPASINGLPTTAGTFTFTVTVTDGQGRQGSEPGSITIQPATSTPFSLSFSPACVRGGSSSTGTVMLSGPAPVGGAVVGLFSNNQGVVTVPASVTVPAGAQSATFIASTKPVSSSTSVQLAASYGGQDQWAVLYVSSS
jgi:Putative Ig domain